MDIELTRDQLVVLALCCKVAGDEQTPYWEHWFTPTKAIITQAVEEGIREEDFAEALQSLIVQGYVLLPPTVDLVADSVEAPIPTRCQVSGLGFEKYAEARVDQYHDRVEQVAAVVSSTEHVRPQDIAEQVGITPTVAAHILHFYELL
jgi:hypothetical protein